MSSSDSFNPQYEDADLVVIEKPVGLVVNRAQSVREPTVQDWMEKTGRIKPGGASPFFLRSGTVHRLDKVTSGLLIVAKTPTAFDELQRQFKNREVRKEYLALAHGWLTPRKGEISLPVGRKRNNRREFGVILGGRPSLTHYETETLYLSPRQESVCLLRLRPRTGRTHQLRVHLKYLGHPLVGDPVYGGRKNIRHDSAWCPRLFLHAAALTFYHPRSGKVVSVSSQLPTELTSVLSKLQKK